MAAQQAFQELVVLFDDSRSKIDLEMRFGQFNSLLQQKGTLASHAGTTARAAYAQVGAELAVRGLVFFKVRFNDEGYMDPAFNLPLEYMAVNAGEGPDLGAGPIKMACRSQCPVPWHGINMWEPSGEGELHPATVVQNTVRRNALGLKMIARPGLADPASEGVDQDIQSVVDTVASLQQAMTAERARAAARAAAVPSSGSQRVAVGQGTATSRVPGAQNASGAAPTTAPPRKTAPPSKTALPRKRAEVPAGTGRQKKPRGTRRETLPRQSASGPSRPPQTAQEPGTASRPTPADGTTAASALVRKPNGIARMRVMEARLSTAFGEDGRVSMNDYAHQHREQMGEVAAQFRAEMERQQQGYLEQIKNCRQEIQKLKSALRHEQKRNQRLQELLRGDVF